MRAVGFVPDVGHNGSWLRSGRRPSRARSGATTRDALGIGVHPRPASVAKTRGAGPNRSISVAVSRDRHRSRPARTGPLKSATMAVGFVPDDGRGRCGRCPRRAGTSVHRASGLGPLGDLGNPGGLSDGFRIRTSNPGSASSFVFELSESDVGLGPPTGNLSDADLIRGAMGGIPRLVGLAIDDRASPKRTTATPTIVDRRDRSPKSRGTPSRPSRPST